MANEAFARVKIDQLLKGADWSPTDSRSVRFEYPLDISTDIRIADDGHLNQMVWIKVACWEIVAGRHKLPVEMASHHP